MKKYLPTPKFLYGADTNDTSFLSGSYVYKYDIMFGLYCSLTTNKQCLNVHLLSMCSICDSNESMFDTADMYDNANAFMSSAKVTNYIYSICTCGVG